MSFKKNNLNKKSPLIINLIGVISLCLIFLLGIIIIRNIDFFNFKINTINTLKTTKLNINNSSNKAEVIGKIEKKEDKINILIVGRGGIQNDAPNLTDTIILASIDKKNKIISMLSIPRDLYVEYPEKNDSNAPDIYKDGKINGLYARYSFKTRSKKFGMDILKKKISDITGEKIDYFVNIDFNGFTKIINTIGGIDITVPTDFIDKQYPDGNWGYKTITFKKGTWTFDGDNALKYARSRHSTSDFDRSLRQQQVISSIKNKLTGGYFFTSPGKIKELYNVFKKYVFTDLNLSTLIQLAYSLNGNGEYTIISSNLNDSCFYGSDTCSKGGFLYTPNRSFFGGMSVLLVEGTDSTKLNNYKKLLPYTDLLFNYSQLYTENYKINIFNSLKINNLAGVLSNDVVKYGFNVPGFNSIGNTKEVYKKSIILYNNIDSNSETLKALKRFFKGEFKKTESPLYSKDNANIEMIIGEDFLGDNNLFQF